MTDVTVYWYRHTLKQHYKRMKRLMRFVEFARPPLAQIEEFDQAVRDIETLYNAAFVEELNDHIKRRQNVADPDDLPF